MTTFEACFTLYLACSLQTSIKHHLEKTSTFKVGKVNKRPTSNRQPPLPYLNKKRKKTEVHKRSIDYHFSTGLQSLNSLYGSSSRFFIINCLLLNQIITSEIIDN